MNLTVTVAPEQIDAIAERAAEIVLARLDASADRGGWLDVKAAAEYLGCTEGRVRKLVERRQIPYSQEAPGCRVFLSKADLDRWMDERRS